MTNHSQTYLLADAVAAAMNCAVENNTHTRMARKQAALTCRNLADEFDKNCKTFKRVEFAKHCGELIGGVDTAAFVANLVTLGQADFT